MEILNLFFEVFLLLVILTQAFLIYLLSNFIDYTFQKAQEAITYLKSVDNTSLTSKSSKLLLKQWCF